MKPHIYPSLGSREIRNQRFSLSLSHHFSLERRVPFDSRIRFDRGKADQFPRALTVSQRDSRRCIGCHAHSENDSRLWITISRLPNSMAVTWEREPLHTYRPGTCPEYLSPRGVAFVFARGGGGYGLRLYILTRVRLTWFPSHGRPFRSFSFVNITILGSVK